jgi:hypothetical protein
MVGPFRRPDSYIDCWVKIRREMNYEGHDIEVPCNVCMVQIVF